MPANTEPRPGMLVALPEDDSWHCVEWIDNGDPIATGGFTVHDGTILLKPRAGLSDAEVMDALATLPGALGHAFTVEIRMETGSLHINKSERDSDGTPVARWYGYNGCAQHAGRGRDHQKEGALRQWLQQAGVQP